MKAARLLCLLACLLLAVFTSAAMAANGEVLSHQKISDTEGGFTGMLDDNDRYGVSVASLSDLDGDGVVDVADLFALLGAWGTCQ